MTAKNQETPETPVKPIETGSLVAPGLDVSTEAGIAAELGLFTDVMTGLNASGKNQKIPVETLKLHPDNPREELDTDTMCASYRHRGYAHSAPILVSKRASGEMFVLRGNRRTAAAQWLQTNEPETFKRVFPDGKLPCLVLTGLTLADEIGLLIDHGKEQDRRALSKREELTAMRKLIQAGIKGRDAIARALDLITRTKDEKTGRIVEKVRGPYVQPRLALLALPMEIQEKFAESSPMFGGDDSRFAQKFILGKLEGIDDSPGLTACLGDDRKSGSIGSDGFGPKLRAAWSKLLAFKPETATAVDRYIAESKASALLQACKSNSAQALINVLAGFNQKDKLADVDARIVAVEGAQRMLAGISGAVGPVEFADLCERGDKWMVAEEKRIADEKAKAEKAGKTDSPVATEESEESEVEDGVEVNA